MWNLTKLAGAICITFSSPALCGEWWHVGTAGEDPNRVAYFADAETATTQGSLRRVWVERILEKVGDQNELSLKSLYMFDCKEMKMSEMQRYLFDNESRALKSPKITPQWDYVPPDTMAARLLSFICSGNRTGFTNIDAETPLGYSQNRIFQIIE